MIQVCCNNHERIYYEGSRNCPLCTTVKEMQEKIDSLDERIDDSLPWKESLDMANKRIAQLEIERSPLWK